MTHLAAESSPFRVAAPIGMRIGGIIANFRTSSKDALGGSYRVNDYHQLVNRIEINAMR